MCSNVLYIISPNFTREILIIYKNKLILNSNFKYRSSIFQATCVKVNHELQKNQSPRLRITYPSLGDIFIYIYPNGFSY